MVYNTYVINMFSKYIILDLLILIAILGIIFVIAHPLYTNHVISTKRLEAKISLLNLAASLERYHSKHKTYKTATINTDATTDVLANDMTIDNLYKISITSSSSKDFTIVATPQATQAKEDLICGTLSITKFGEKNISGTGPISKCW